MERDVDLIIVLSQDADGQWHARCNDLDGFGETPQDATDDLLDAMTEVGYF